MQNVLISNLQSGGLITNYYCTSKCRHCLYACSPKWPKEYISREDAEKFLEITKSHGIYSLHIGGGEPFLDKEGLLKVVQAARNANVKIDYIETNSSWFKNTSEDKDLLLALQNNGVNTLLVSISPFHNEYIPFKKVHDLIKGCSKLGLSVFPWVQQFVQDISIFDENKVHPMDEYINTFGEDYLHTIPQRYWIHYGGRALETFRDVLPRKTTENILSSSKPCYELTDTTHFHVDLHGNYIPGLCSGLAIKIDDLGRPLKSEQYKFITILYNEGIEGFFNYARDNHGFKEKETYLNKCDLCLDIRKFLVNVKHVKSKELEPETYYQEL
jgi:hypothetical protein